MGNRRRLNRTGNEFVIKSALVPNRNNFSRFTPVANRSPEKKSIQSFKQYKPIVRNN